jgi:hypothetical protein
MRLPETGLFHAGGWTDGWRDQKKLALVLRILRHTQKHRRLNSFAKRSVRIFREDGEMLWKTD